MSSLYAELSVLTKEELAKHHFDTSIDYQDCFNEALEKGAVDLVRALWTSVPLTGRNAYYTCLIKHISYSELRALVRDHIIINQDRVNLILERLERDWNKKFFDWFVESEHILKRTLLYLDGNAQPRSFTSWNLIQAIDDRFTLSDEDWGLILSNVSHATEAGRQVLYKALAKFYANSDVDAKWIQEVLNPGYLMVAAYDKLDLVFREAVVKNRVPYLTWACLRRQQLPRLNDDMLARCLPSTLDLLFKNGCLEKEDFLNKSFKTVKVGWFPVESLDWMCDHFSFVREDFDNAGDEWVKRRFPVPTPVQEPDCVADPTPDPVQDSLQESVVCHDYDDMLTYLTSGKAEVKAGCGVDKVVEFQTDLLAISKERERDMRLVLQQTILQRFNDLYVYCPVEASASDSDSD